MLMRMLLAVVKGCKIMELKSTSILSEEVSRR